MAHTMELLLCCSLLHRHAGLCCFCCPPLLVSVDVSLRAVELPTSMRLLQLLPPLLVVVLLPLYATLFQLKQRRKARLVRFGQNNC
jgi:hypothetical protein